MDLPGADVMDTLRNTPGMMDDTIDAVRNLMRAETTLKELREEMKLPEGVDLKAAVRAIVAQARQWHYVKDAAKREYVRAIVISFAYADPNDTLPALVDVIAHSCNMTPVLDVAKIQDGISDDGQYFASSIANAVRDMMVEEYRQGKRGLTENGERVK